MRPIKEQQQEKARELFFQSDLNRSQIAEQVGVSEKTIYLWTKLGDWRRLKSASRLMPSLMVEHFYSQVQELNESIYNREPGHRYPTVQEAEICRKLILTAERVKKKQTRGEYSEMFQKFMQWLLPQNEEHLKLFTDYANAFLTQSPIRGFHPYDIEYGEEEQESSPPYFQGGVPAEPNDAQAGGGGSPLASLREASQAHEQGATKQPRQNTDLPEVEPESKGNNSTESYELNTNDLGHNATTESEITREQEEGNNLLASLRGTKQSHDNMDKAVSIGYLGQKQDIDPNGIKTIEYKPDETIQKFSIGDAIYYIKKKE